MPVACGVLQALEQGRGESLWPLGGRQVANAGPLPFADNLARARQGQTAGGVGLAGIKAGDYFLVEFPGQKGQGWQLMVIESTGNSTSVARMMKKTPNVPLNATAVLMQ